MFVALGRAVRIVGDREKTEQLVYPVSIFVNLNAHWTGENENVCWQERPEVHLKLLENQAAPNNAKFLKLNNLPGHEDK